MSQKHANFGGEGSWFANLSKVLEVKSTLKM